MPQAKQLRTANVNIAQTQSSDVPMRDERIHVPDLEAQLNGRDGLRGWSRLCRQQRRDTRHMVLPRFTEIYSYCLNSQAKHLPSLEEAVKRAEKAGEDTSELLDKLSQATLRYGQTLLQANKIHALGQPDSRFLRNLFPIVRGVLKDDDSSFLDQPIDDWVLVSCQDRLDRFIARILATDIGSVVARPFRSNTEMIGEHRLDDYHEELMKFVIFTVFSLILGIFTCAPAGIQSLNVVSTIGEVAVYVAFVIVFGWLCLGLIGGFEKSLLASLCFAGLMANLLRGDR